MTWWMDEFKSSTELEELGEVLTRKKPPRKKWPVDVGEIAPEPLEPTPIIATSTP